MPTQWRPPVHALQAAVPQLRDHQVIVLLWAVSVQQLVLLGGGGTAVAGRTDPDPDLHADLKGGAAADASVDVVGRGSREGGEDEEAGEDEEEVIRLLSILMARLASSPGGFGASAGIPPGRRSRGKSPTRPRLSGSRGPSLAAGGARRPSRGPDGEGPARRAPCRFAAGLGQRRWLRRRRCHHCCWPPSFLWQ